MPKGKGLLVTVLITVLLVLLGADAVAIWPEALPWVLGVFAVPGVYLFSKYLYRWLTAQEDVNLRTMQELIHARKRTHRGSGGVKQETREYVP